MTIEHARAQVAARRDATPEHVGDRAVERDFAKSAKESTAGHPVDREDPTPHPLKREPEIERSESDAAISRL